MEKQLILSFLFLLLIPATLMTLSGDSTWLQGWVFSAWFLALCYTTIWYLYKHDPELLNEQYRRPGSGGQAGWDRFVIAGLVLGFVSWILIMPLDARRYEWSPPFPVWFEAMGIAALLGSFVLFFRSFKDNAYLSPLVRVQGEQKVVSAGVYGLVRHPMYLGAALMLIGAPLLLGSIIGLIIGALIVLLLVARIQGEEALLVKELAGYPEYQKKVRYRLLPFVW